MKELKPITCTISNISKSLYQVDKKKIKNNYELLCEWCIIVFGNKSFITIQSRDVACFQTKAIFINTTRKKQDARSTNKIQDCLIGTLELELDGEKL